MNNTVIDLTRLAAPELVETINFETLLAERKAKLVSLYPAEKQAEVAATLELESEPMVMLLQENCYREITLRQRINDAGRAVMLAYAKGTDLDHLAAFFGIARLVVTPADTLNEIPAVMESDDDLRKRVQLAPDSFSVAGPEGAYKSNAIGADGQVLDAAVSSPAPGAVLVTVLSRAGNGLASDELVAKVAAAVGAEDVRPLTDLVVAQSAEIVEYEVEALVYTFAGPDREVVMAAARARLDSYTEECHRIGREVPVSGLHAALHVEGVERVELVKPAASVQTNSTQAPYCIGVTLIPGGGNG